MTRDTERVAVEELRAQPVLSIRATVPVADLAETQGLRLRELREAIDQGDARPAGPPFVRYHSFRETETDVEVGVPIAEAVAAGGNVVSGDLPAGPALKTWHLGPHDRLGDAYGRLQAWLAKNGRVPNGAAWEVYWWIDASKMSYPWAWPPPAEWRTELVQPIAE